LSLREDNLYLIPNERQLFHRYQTETNRDVEIDASLGSRNPLQSNYWEFQRKPLLNISKYPENRNKSLGKLSSYGRIFSNMNIHYYNRVNLGQTGHRLIPDTLLILVFYPSKLLFFHSTRYHSIEKIDLYQN
jgi:hypothetical protein